MNIGFVGLGNMGRANARHLHEAGAEVVVWNRSEAPAEAAVKLGMRRARSLPELAREIGVPRAVKLASNEVAFPPLPAVVAAITAVVGETNRYPDNGASVLTGALAARYGVDPAQVATGCGAVTLLQQVAQSYTEPGTSMVFAWRSFEMYPLLAQVAEARCTQMVNPKYTYICKISKEILAAFR